MAERVASIYVELEARVSQLEQELRRAEKSIDQVGKAARGSSMHFTEMWSAVKLVKGSLSTVVETAQKAWQTIGQGAELELAKNRFDNLTASIGTTADALMDDLSAATSGMMSNADMITSASQIIGLGLGDTQEDVVNLASLVSQLGWDMQTVIMTFANNSKARLDSLGLSVEDVTTRAKALEEQGYDTDKAFDLAVIEAGKAKLELLGSAADTTAGKMKRLEAAWENVTDQIKLNISQAAEPAIDYLLKTADANEVLRQAVARGIITQDQANRGTSKYSAVIRQLRIDIKEYDLQQEQRLLTEAKIEDAYRIQTPLMDSMIGRIQAHDWNLRELREAWGEAFGGMESYRQGLEYTAGGLQEVDTRAHGVGLTLLGLPTDHTFTLNLVTVGSLPNLSAYMGTTGGAAGVTGVQASAIAGGEITASDLYAPGGIYTGPGTGPWVPPEMGGPSPPPQPVPYGGWGPSGGGTVPGRASGGAVYGGRPYVVGERGPELFVPKQPGDIVANDKMGNTYNFNLDGRLLARIEGGRMTAGYFAEQVAVRG